LRGDVKRTLAALLPLISETRRPEWNAKIMDLRREEADYLDTRDGMTPRNAILTLNRHLGANTAVATDVGQHQMWAAQNLVFQSPRRFVTSGGLGTMGFGLGAAIGAAFGTGERSVLVTGDGNFGMCLNELATAVSYGVPVVILILNNGVLGMVRQWQTLFYEKHYSNTVMNRKTDFSAFARSFGADGEAVSTVEELDAALTRAFAAEGPYVVDCAIDKDEFVLPMLPPGGSMDDIIVKAGV
ncbi:MAG: acetolactate synthase large subunit, partial [Clostridia bacterium]|nr:acetolactate synthase large subunit [Clostridia bacterium]